MDVVVARIGRPHGIRGEVSVQVRTDDPGRRFVAGAVFPTDPATAGPLTLRAARDHNGVTLLTFAELVDRSAAEAARGVLLLAPADQEDEPEAWYDHDLVGLAVRLDDGRAVGKVVGVEHGPAQDLLVIAEPGAGQARVPFVAAIVPVVDVAGGFVVVTPPGGLLAAVPAPGDESAAEGEAADAGEPA